MASATKKTRGTTGRGMSASKGAAGTSKRRRARAGAEPSRSRLGDGALHDAGIALRDPDPELGNLSDEAITELASSEDVDPLTDFGTPEGGTTPRAHAPGDRALAAGDVDADTSDASSGEEEVSGSSSTPDQNDVDEIGSALGITYAPDEPLHTTEKIEQRDVDRWELNPASAEDFVERQIIEQAPPRTPRRRRRTAR